MSDLMLRRKWTLRAHDRQIVLVKRANEKSTHVLMKALVWALYLPEFSDLSVEVGVGDRFKPDVVSTDSAGNVRFWGECGEVGRRKIESLLRRYRDTHLVFAKWDTPLTPLIETVERLTSDRKRSAPVDLLRFPADSSERFIPDGRDIDIRLDELVRWRVA